MKSFLLTTAFALLAFPAFPALADSVTEAIEARSLEFEAAFNAGDSAAVANLYAPDAAILPPGGARIDGREKIAAFWAGAIESGLADLDLIAAEVIATGDSALDVGTLTLSAPGENGARVVVAAKYVVHWIQIDGGWHLHRDIWNLGQ
ncbi:SnoaL-like domain protein [Roseovarius gaetbuli]|uniref:SnoaL-like domain protein n=1 Tax=Roseovarius gaetbuli TaxID=1356575 RepID=A0A1X6YKE1_9RHOB|nr:SgcJ/EcaC family oxidoreductase [Roseovarius gaetbuli]SLN22181.1 SnoaL-like domain protein [Roseovarius gaetbuli]